MILQLNPTIPLDTPKGAGQALLVIDYGSEHHLMWTVAIDSTGEIWTFSNPEVRAQKNITVGRLLNSLSLEDIIIEDLDLTVRITNILKEEGIKTLNDLINTSYSKLIVNANIGRKSMAEIKQCLDSRGLSMRY